MTANHIKGMFITILVLWPGTVPAFDKADIIKLYNQGNEMFRQANSMASKKPKQAKELYAKAAMRFERIVREGNIENGKLYYNIGNAYFRMGKLGRAILNYCRATRYIPNDENLHNNLEYARGRRHDKIEEKQEAKLLKTFLFWHYDLSLKTRSIICAVFFGLFWSGASIRLFSKKMIPKWSLLCLGIVSILFLSSLIFEITIEKGKKTGVILAEEVIGRKGDSETYQKSFKEPLHTGTEFHLIEERGKWYHIELSDGRACWIPNNAVEFV